VRSVEQIAEGVRKARALMAKAIASLGAARERLGEAGSDWSASPAGTTDAEVSRLLGQVSELLAGYLADLGVPVEPAPAGAPGQSAPAGPARSSGDQGGDQEDDHDDLVGQARRELPPPVTRGRGVKTHGRRFAPGRTLRP